jgi:hypothetical protein
LEERSGKLVPIPEKLRIVETIFRLCIEGFGLSHIVKHLTAAKIPPFGGAQYWSKAYLHKLLAGRAVLGEHQPMRGQELDGLPIGGYYPAIISQDTWDIAKAALASRKDKRGATGEKVANLFGGLLRDATTKDHLRIAWQTRGTTAKGRQKKRVLVTAKSMEGAAPSQSFPHEIFEEAVLRLLKEVDPADVLGEEPASETMSLTASLTRVDVSIEALVGDMEANGESAILFQRLRQKETERQELAKRLADAKQRERTPRSTAFAAVKTLLDVAKDEPNRLRLRELLRTIVEEIWVLIVPRRSHRLAAVQVFFKGGGRRDYLIHYQAAAYCRSGGWSACSLAGPTNSKNLDLRHKQDTGELAKILTKVDCGLLVEAMQQELA